MESKVEKIEIKKFEKMPSENEIISRIAGNDKTDGSCSSAAFAYAANKGGYDVLDFRGGKSRRIFASIAYIKDIANLGNIESHIIKDYNDFSGVKKLLANVQDGKEEYYLAAGHHAAIVHKSDSGFEYLELQSEKNKGYHKLDSSILKKRFKCQKSHTSYGNKYEVSSVLIEIESLVKNKEFLNLMGYINTNANNQLKGAGGGIK